jgi:hypothetical protein
MGARRLGQILLALLFSFLILAQANRAEAQYKSYTFGFEGGYLAMTDGIGLKAHNFDLGIFGGWKASDRWWFAAKADLSFPGQLNNAPNTVIVLQLAPIMVKQYFLTDAFRPSVGLTNAFFFTINGDASVPTAVWGPGVNAGMEFKLARDLFLGFEGTAYYTFNFDGGDAAVFTVNTQIIFFL